MAARTSPSDGFVTPTLGPVLFWFYAVLVGLGCGFAIAAGQWITALLYAGAIIAVRLFIEIALALIRILEVLTEIRDQGTTLAAPRTTPPRPPAPPARPAPMGEMRLDPTPRRDA